MPKNKVAKYHCIISTRFGVMALFCFISPFSRTESGLYNFSMLFSFSSLPNLLSNCIGSKTFNIFLLANRDLVLLCFRSNSMYLRSPFVFFANLNNFFCFFYHIFFESLSTSPQEIIQLMIYYMPWE